VESNHHSTRRQGYSLLSSPMLSVRTSEGWPAGLEPAPAGITTPGASVYTTATTKAGTTGLEPAASRLTSECSARLSYAPEGRGGRRDRLPCSVTSSARPSAGQSLIARVGFEPTVSSS
jgi:hypothetical protein